MKEKRNIKKGFSLFETKPFSAEIGIDSTNYRDTVPPIYNLFSNSFIMDVDILNLFYEGKASKNLIGGYIPQIDEIRKGDLTKEGYLPFEGFFKLDFSFGTYLSEEYEHWSECGLAMIGPEPWEEGGYLLVVDEEKVNSTDSNIFYLNLKRDNVIVEMRTGDYYKLADNIFDFVRCLEFVVPEEIDKT